MQFLKKRGRFPVFLCFMMLLGIRTISITSAGENDIMDERTPLPMRSFNHENINSIESCQSIIDPAFSEKLNTVITNHSPGINVNALLLSSVGLSVFPVFAALSKNCAGIKALDNLAGEIVCGVGGGAAITSVFLVLTYKTHELLPPLYSENTKYYQTARFDKIKEFALYGLYFGIGYVATIPVAYLNMIEMPQIKEALPLFLMLSWSEIAHLAAGLNYIYVSYNLAHELLPMISHNIFCKKDPNCHKKLQIKQALSRYIHHIGEMSAEEIHTLHSTLYHRQSAGDVWKDVFRKANTTTSQQKTISYSVATICLGASAIAILSGYANWPLSIDSMESYAKFLGVIDPGFWVNASGQLVGATGFFVLAALNGLTSFETFQQIIDGIWAAPSTIKSIPGNIRHYFSTPESVQQKIAPVAKIALNGLTLYATICAPLNLLNITNMETNGIWNKFLQGCVIVANTTQSFFSFKKIANGIYNRFFACSETERKREHLISLMDNLKRHVKFMNDTSIDIIWHESFSFVDTTI